MNRVRFQLVLALPGFLKEYGTEAQCERAHAAVRGPTGFRCPRCEGQTDSVFRDGARKVFQCTACRHQTSLIASTIFQSSKLPLTTWFLAIYLISQAKTGLSALALKRHFGVSCPPAWLIHHELMQATSDREDRYVLDANVQGNDAYLGGERTGGKDGRGSESKVSFVPAVLLTDDHRPLRVRLTPVPGFTAKAIETWAKDALAPGSAVFSAGLACFGAVPDVDCSHHRTVMAGRKPREVLAAKWINTVLGNLKTSLSGSDHAFDFQKYAARYLAAFSYRFNRRFDLHTLHQRLLVAAACSSPQRLRSIRAADDHC